MTRRWDEGLNGIIRNSEIIGVLVLTGVAESVFANYFRTALYLDLPLVLALYIGWYSRPVKGAVCGAALGWLQDAISGIYLGLNGLSKTLLGFIGSYLSKWLVLESFIARCFLIGGLALIDNAIVIGMGGLLGQSIRQDIWMRSLIEVPVTGISGGFIFHMYDRVKFPRKDFSRL